MKLKMILLAAGAVFVASNVQAKPLQYTNVEQNVVMSVVADDYETFMRGGNSFIADAYFRQLGSEGEVIVTQPVSLDREFQENEVRASKTYKKAPVLLEYSKIESINLDAFGRPYLTLFFYDQFRQPQAIFVKGEQGENDAANLQRGQNVVLACVGVKYVMRTLILDNCRIAENVAAEYAKKATLMATGREDFDALIDSLSAKGITRKMARWLIPIMSIRISEALSEEERKACNSSPEECLKIVRNSKENGLRERIKSDAVKQKAKIRLQELGCDTDSLK